MKAVMSEYFLSFEMCLLRECFRGQCGMHELEELTFCLLGLAEEENQ